MSKRIKSDFMDIEYDTRNRVDDSSLYKPRLESRLTADFCRVELKNFKFPPYFNIYNPGDAASATVSLFSITQGGTLALAVPPGFYSSSELAAAVTILLNASGNGLTDTGASNFSMLYDPITNRFSIATAGGTNFTFTSGTGDYIIRALGQSGTSTSATQSLTFGSRVSMQGPDSIFLRFDEFENLHKNPNGGNCTFILPIESTLKNNWQFINPHDKYGPCGTISLLAGNNKQPQFLNLTLSEFYGDLVNLNHDFSFTLRYHF